MSARIRALSLLLSIGLIVLIAWNGTDNRSVVSLLGQAQSSEGCSKICSEQTSGDEHSALKYCALCRLEEKRKLTAFTSGLHTQLMSQIFEEDPRDTLTYDIVGINAKAGADNVEVTGSNDGFMDASELPTHTLNQGILDYCMSRFPVPFLERAKNTDHF